MRSHRAPRLGRSLAGAPRPRDGPRNLLAHGNAEVDDDLVVSSLDDLDDCQYFIDQVRTWAVD